MNKVTAFLEVLRRRQLVVIATLIAGLIGVFFLLRFVPRTYEAAARVLIVNESDGRDPSVSSIDLPEVTTSTVVLSRVIDKLKLPVSLISMKKEVKARVKSRSSIMEISYRDRSPDLAVGVANAVADQLTRYYGEIATNRADENVSKLDAAVDAAQRRLRKLNGQLAKESAMHPFVGSDKALESTTARLDDLSTQRQVASATLAADSAQLQAISDSSGTLSSVARHEILENDAVHRELVSGAAKDAAQLTFDRSVYTDKYPGLRGLETKVKTERDSIAAEERRALSSPNAFSAARADSVVQSRKAAAVVSGDQARLDGIDGLIATEQARLAAIPQAGVSASQLRLQRDAAQADYLALSSRRASAVANRAEALSLGSVVVVDRAVRADAEVVGLGRSRLAIVTALFVLALAFASAFLAELLDPRLRRKEQIERLYGSPLLATLSKEA